MKQNQCHLLRTNTTKWGINEMNHKILQLILVSISLKTKENKKLQISNQNKTKSQLKKYITKNKKKKNQPKSNIIIKKCLLFVFVKICMQMLQIFITIITNYYQNYKQILKTKHTTESATVTKNRPLFTKLFSF